MVGLDEPAHARLRKPAARAFSMKRVQAMIPAIDATAIRLLDQVAGARDHPQLKEWCGYRAALSWGRPGPQDQIEIAASIAAYRRYLRDLTGRKHQEPGDDLTSDLLAIHREDPDRLTLDEISSILFSLSFAGHETTTGLIGNTVRRLLEDPRRWEAVAADPDLIPGAVEECLRYDPSVPVWRRVTTRPVRLGGVDLPRGAKLFLWLAAAGRDAEVFTDPDHFDLRRPDADRHLAFGKGLSTTAWGANLGKLETQIALSHLTRRYPQLRLASQQQFSFHPNISFRGPQALLVRAAPYRG